MCESFRIKAVACRANYSDSDVVSRSFAVMIHEKDKKRLLWEGYYLDDDLIYNTSHPATLELDRVIRKTRTYIYIYIYIYYVCMYMYI